MSSGLMPYSNPSQATMEYCFVVIHPNKHVEHDLIYPVRVREHVIEVKILLLVGETRRKVSRLTWAHKGRRRSRQTRIHEGIDKDWTCSVEDKPVSGAMGGATTLVVSETQKAIQQFGSYSRVWLVTGPFFPTDRCICPFTIISFEIEGLRFLNKVRWELWQRHSQ